MAIKLLGWAAKQKGLGWGNMSPTSKAGENRPADAVGPWSQGVVGIPGSSSYDKKQTINVPRQSGSGGGGNSKLDDMMAQFKKMSSANAGNKMGSVDYGSIKPNIDTGPVWSQGRTQGAQQQLAGTQARMPELSPRHSNAAQGSAMDQMLQSAVSGGATGAAVNMGRDMAFKNNQQNLGSNQAYVGREMDYANQQTSDYASRRADNAARESILATMMRSFV